MVCSRAALDILDKKLPVYYVNKQAAFLRIKSEKNDGISCENHEKNKNILL